MSFCPADEGVLCVLGDNNAFLMRCSGGRVENFSNIKVGLFFGNLGNPVQRLAAIDEKGSAFSGGTLVSFGVHSCKIEENTMFHLWEYEP